VVGKWGTTIDPETGWVRIDSGENLEDREHVEFAGRTVAAISGGKLAALWLRPAWIASQASNGF
jgi:hypothetical protein